MYITILQGLVNSFIHILYLAYFTIVFSNCTLQFCCSCGLTPQLQLQNISEGSCSFNLATTLSIATNSRNGKSSSKLLNILDKSLST